MRQEGVLWMNITNPTEADAQYLRKKFKFHPLNLEDCLSKTERPKIDEYGKYLFMILHFPVWNPRLKRMSVAEVSFFLSSDFIIAIHSEKIPEISSFFEKIKKKGKNDLFKKGTSFILYEILSNIFEKLPYTLDRLLKSSRKIEKEIFEKGGRDLLKEIMNLKRDVIIFRRIISPERLVLAALEHKHKKYVRENSEFYFDDIVDNIERTWGSLEALKETIENLQETNENIISHETNNVIKILTIFSAIMLPITFVTSFYGMNIHLPFENSEYAGEIVLFFILMIGFGMFYFFRWKKWI